MDNLIKLEFDPAIDVTTTWGRTVNISETYINKIIDSPLKKKITVELSYGAKLVVWENEDYDQVGDWTKSNLVDRVKSLLTI